VAFTGNAEVLKRASKSSENLINFFEMKNTVQDISGIEKWFPGMLPKVLLPKGTILIEIISVY
jgi:hypothetical protein